MVGKTLTSRIILLILAVILFVLLWIYGASSEVMYGATFLVVLRVIFVITQIANNKGFNNDNDQPSN